MSVNNFSPINAKLIESNLLKANNEAKVNVQDSQQKPTKKINKKALAFGAAAAVGVTALAIGGIIYKRKIAPQKAILAEAEKIKQKAAELLNTSDTIDKKANAIQEEAEQVQQKAAQISNTSNTIHLKAYEIQKEATQIEEKSKNLYDEILSYIEKWDENEPDKVIETSKGAKGTFEAKTTDGKLIPTKFIETKGDEAIRETEISELKPVTIIEFIEGTKNNNFNQYEFSPYNSFCYTKGYQRCADGTSKFDVCFDFLNNSIYSYEKDWQMSADRAQKIAEQFYFKDSLIHSYQKDWQKSADGISKFDELFIYYNGLFGNYQKDQQMSADGAQKIAEQFYFKGGSLNRYGKDYQETSDGVIKAAEEYIIKDGKLQKIS